MNKCELTMNNILYLKMNMKWNEHYAVKKSCFLLVHEIIEPYGKVFFRKS